MPGNIHIPTPAEIAEWPTPDYENGIRREWLPTFCIVFLVVSTVLTCLRVGLRIRKQGGGLGLDDALLIPSWFMLVGFTCCVIYASKAGIIDRHMWDMEYWKYEKNALNAWIGQLVFLMGTCCIKVSILLFHRRMVKGTFARRWKWAVWIAIIFTTLYTFVLLVFLLANCQPTESYWKYLDPDYQKEWKCIDTRWINYAAGIFAVVSDFYALCLPWCMIWPLEMPRKQKIGLNIIFGMGVFSIVAAGLRTNSLVALGYSNDLTWVGFWLYLWSILEWNLGIICACAPSLRVVFREYLRPSMAKAWSSNSTRNRTCGGQDMKHWGENSDHPARAIQLRRTLTVESSAPVMKSKEKHFVSQTESEATTFTEEQERNSSFASSRRQGVAHIPRAYRIALRQDLSESQETLHQISGGRSHSPPPQLPLTPRETRF